MEDMMQTLAGRMHFLRGNMAVIAQNVANADTPGYKASAVKKQENNNQFNNLVAASNLAITNPKHLSGSNGAGSVFGGAKPSSTPFETVPTGNSVDLEQQMIEMGAVSADYQMATNVYKQAQRMLKLSFGRGG